MKVWVKGESEPRTVYIGHPVGFYVEHLELEAADARFLYVLACRDPEALRVLLGQLEMRFPENRAAWPPAPRKLSEFVRGETSPLDGVPIEETGRATQKR